MGRTHGLSPAQVQAVLAAFDARGATKAAAECGIDRETVYRYVRRRKAGKGPGPGQQVAPAAAVVRDGQQGAETPAPQKRRGVGMPPAPPPFPVRRYSLADRRVAKRWVVCADLHYGCHDPYAVDVLYQAIGIIRPDAFCDLGDVGESQAVSRHRPTKKAPPEYLLPEYDDEAAEISGHLDRRDAVLDGAGVRERVQVVGNHDAWWDILADSDPRNSGYAFATQFRLVERKFRVVPHSGEQWYPLAPGLLATHGDVVRSTIGHPRAMLAQAGGPSVIYGHFHVAAAWLEPGRDPATGGNVQRRAYAVGTMKDRRHEANLWLRGTTHRWGPSFAIVDVYGDNTWCVQSVEIEGGRCSLWGEVVTARERCASQAAA